MIASEKWGKGSGLTQAATSPRQRNYGCRDRCSGHSDLDSLCHEGTAVTIACGAALVGKRAVVYCEATGFVLSMYNLQSMAMQFGLPIMFLISYTGSPGDKANSLSFSLWGRLLEAQIQTLGLQYRVLEDGHDLETRVADMAWAAQFSKFPTCLLFTGEFTAFPGLLKRS